MVDTNLLIFLIIGVIIGFILGSIKQRNKTEVDN